MAELTPSEIDRERQRMSSTELPEHRRRMLNAARSWTPTPVQTLRRVPSTPNVTRRTNPAAAASSPVAAASPDNTRILHDLLSQGFSKPQIADALHITEDDYVQAKFLLATGTVTPDFTPGDVQHALELAEGDYDDAAKYLVVNAAPPAIVSQSDGSMNRNIEELVRRGLKRDNAVAALNLNPDVEEAFKLYQVELLVYLEVPRELARGLLERNHYNVDDAMEEFTGNPERPVAELNRQIQVYDLYNAGDVTAAEFLIEQKEEKPFIVKKNDKFTGVATGWPTPDTGKIFYECNQPVNALGAEPYSRYRLDRGRVFVKMTVSGGESIFVLKPDWWDGDIPGTGYFNAVLAGTVANIFTEVLLDGIPPGADVPNYARCNQATPQEYYRLEAISLPELDRLVPRPAAAAPLTLPQLLERIEIFDPIMPGNVPASTFFDDHAQYAPFIIKMGGSYCGNAMWYKGADFNDWDGDVYGYFNAPGVEFIECPGDVPVEWSSHGYNEALSRPGLKRYINVLIGGGKALVHKPEWWDSKIVPGTKFFKTERAEMLPKFAVAQLSRWIELSGYDSYREYPATGIDHCNQKAPVQTYRLIPMTLEELQKSIQQGGKKTKKRILKRSRRKQRIIQSRRKKLRKRSRMVK